MTKQNINELINYIREKYKDPESAIKILADYKEDYIPSLLVNLEV